MYKGSYEMKYYVGIDVAKDKNDCLWLKDTESLKVKTKVLPNTQAGFKTLRSWFEKNITTELSDIHVSLEATSIYHEGLAYALYHMGVKVSIVNPAQVRNFAKGLGVRNKTDRKDSHVLARYGALTNPRLWQPEPEAVRTLKALISRLSALETDLQREQNRMEKAQISRGSEVVIKSIQTMFDQLKK
jgi:transposase